MKNRYVSPRRAAAALDYTVAHLRKLADAGQIRYIRAPSGQRRYDVASFLEGSASKELTSICYCRVSSNSQRENLERQVSYMREMYPQAEVIRDIGSGINFKRRGLRSLLERMKDGERMQVIVSHKDRLARFGSEIIQFLIELYGGELVVLDKTEHSPEQEWMDDLMTILHVFSCRMYGLRRYRDKIKEAFSNESHAGRNHSSSKK